MGTLLDVLEKMLKLICKDSSIRRVHVTKKVSLNVVIFHACSLNIIRS